MMYIQLTCTGFTNVTFKDENNNTYTFTPTNPKTTYSSGWTSISALSGKLVSVDYTVYGSNAFVSCTATLTYGVTVGDTTQKPIPLTDAGTSQFKEFTMMAGTVYKELKVGTTPVYVESANKDGNGNVISSTYLTTAGTAAKATADASGNTITSYYLPTTKCTYQTTAPTAAISDGGVHIVYLSAEPSTKYSGYIYLIASS